MNVSFLFSFNLDGNDWKTHLLIIVALNLSIFSYRKKITVNINCVAMYDEMPKER